MQRSSPDPYRRLLLAGLAAVTAAGSARSIGAERVRVVGFLTQGGRPARMSALLAELGHVEGRNLRIEVRKAAGDVSELDRAAADLAGSGAEVLVAAGVPQVLALSRATKSIPIVCAGISDPVGEGIARSLRQPGKNVTGLSYGLPEAAVLQVGILRALLPQLRRIVFISDERGQTRPAPAHEAACSAAGIDAALVSVDSVPEMESAFAAIRRPAAEAAWIAVGSERIPMARVAAAAMRHRVATHGQAAEWVRGGLLLCYWTAHSDQLRRVAVLVDKVLRGANPAEIPFELPDKTVFAVNRTTANAIGVALPTDVLIRATELVG